MGREPLSRDAANPAYNLICWKKESFDFMEPPADNFVDIRLGGALTIGRLLYTSELMEILARLFP